MEFGKLHGKEMGGNQIVNGQAALAPPTRHDDFLNLCSE
jgi:hypothetical protein